MPRRETYNEKRRRFANTLAEVGEFLKRLPELHRLRPSETQREWQARKKARTSVR